MVQEQKIRGDGYSVFWVVTAPMHRERLLKALTPLQLARFTPDERTDAAALTEAYRQVYHGPDYDIVARKNRQKDGIEVIRIKRGANGDANGYGLACACRVVDGQVDLIAGHADLPRLQAEFNLAKGTLPGSSVGSALADIVKHLKGTALRPTGGFYWLPGTELDTYKAVSDAVQAAVDGEGRADVYYMTLQMCPETARAVRDGLVEEILAATKEIADDVEGDDTGHKLGARGLETRKKRAIELDEKVQQYEQILGEALPILRQACERAQSVALMAMLAEVEEAVA